MSKDYIDFPCDCGSKKCGRLRFAKYYLPKGSPKILDVGIMYGRQKRPKIGVCIRDKNIDKLIKFLKS